MRIPGLPLLLLVCICSMLAAHFTRFETQLTLNFSPQEISAKFHNNQVVLRTAVPRIDQIKVVMGRSMVAKNNIGAYSVTAEGRIIEQTAPATFYLFGRDILFNLLNAEWPTFRYSYGDWTMDRAESLPVPLIDRPLPENFALALQLLGRGVFKIEFYADQSKFGMFEIRDGYIDNCVGLCVGSTCSTADNDESSWTNAVRILNFFAESILLAALLLIAAKILLICFGAAAAKKRRIFNSPFTTGHQEEKSFLITVVAIALLHLAVCIYVSKVLYASTPHIPDSAQYYKQAVLLSHGRLTTEPVPAEPHEIFLSGSSVLKDGRIGFFHSNHFWPVILAAAINLGVPDLIEPLMSALAVLLIYLLVSRFFSEQTALIASVLYAISPMALIMSGDYMLHIPTQTAILAGFLCGVKAYDRHKYLYAVLSGLLLGYAFGLRQATTVTFLATAGLFIIWHKPRLVFSRHSLSFMSGFTLMMLFFIYDNWLVTDKWLALPHSSIYGRSVKPSNFKIGSNFMDATLGYFPPVFFCFPFPQLLTGMAFAPLIYRFRDFRCWLLFGFFLSLCAIHTMFDDHGMHAFGSRFLFESFWALYALAALFISDLLLHSGKYLKYALSGLFLSALCYNLFLQWHILPQYVSYNGLSSATVVKMRELAAAKTIFVMRGGGWQKMDRGATLIDPLFQNTIIVQEAENGDHQKVIQALPDWQAYLVDDNAISKLAGPASH